MPIVHVDARAYAVFGDRSMLKFTAQEVAHLLRTGQRSRAVARVEQFPELVELGVADAIRGAGELGSRTRVRPPRALEGVRAGWVSDSPRQWRSFSGLQDELGARGVTFNSVLTSDVLEGRVRTRDLPRAVSGRLVDDAGADVFDRLRERGVVVINGVPKSHKGKAFEAEAWRAAGVGAPETITRLGSDRAVARAFDTLGPRVVIKAPFGARGEQVTSHRTAKSAIEEARRIRERPMFVEGMDPELSMPIMQRQVNVDGFDVRLHIARDPHTGMLGPIGAVERRSLTGDFRTNLCAGGGVRPIYDLTGGDPALPRTAIDEAIRAGDALGMDWYAADVALERRTGRPVIFEVDFGAVPLEDHFPAPRANQTFSSIAELLLHADNATLDAARGASLAS